MRAAIMTPLEGNVEIFMAVDYTSVSQVQSLKHKLQQQKKYINWTSSR